MRVAGRDQDIGGGSFLGSIGSGEKGGRLCYLLRNVEERVVCMAGPGWGMEFGDDISG